MKTTKVSRNKMFSYAKRMAVFSESLIDIGPGINRQTLFPHHQILYADPFDQYLLELTKKSRKQDIFLCSTALDIASMLRPDFVDSIVMMDVIEHLDKESGLSVIPKLKDSVRKQLIIFTPLGFIEQSNPGKLDAWGLDGEVFQRHLSGWSPGDFDSDFEFLVCDDFHKVQPHQRYLESDYYGAFFAVYTNPNYQNKMSDQIKKSIFYFRENIYRICRKIKSLL